MKPAFKHRWKLTVESAEQMQRELSVRLSSDPAFKSAEDAKTLAALDVDYNEAKGTATAAAILVELPSLKQLEKVSVTRKLKGLFPYVPGLLSFREAPLLVEALKKLKQDAAVLLVDGQGIAHPRRFGLACHIGLLMGKPSIGCAKTWLYGDYDEPPPGLGGAYTFLRDGDSLLGVVLRSQPFVQPLYVSPGHKMSVLLAADIVMLCVKENRLPEPLRQADSVSRGLAGRPASR